MTFFVYVSLGILSVYMFGSALKKSVLDNVDEEADPSSYVIRVAFLIVLAKLRFFLPTYWSRVWF